VAQHSNERYCNCSVPKHVLTEQTLASLLGAPLGAPLGGPLGAPLGGPPRGGPPPGEPTRPVQAGPPSSGPPRGGPPPSKSFKLLTTIVQHILTAEHPTILFTVHLFTYQVVRLWVGPPVVILP
jgi:hypothetical protein